MENNIKDVISLDDYRNLEDIVKQRLNANTVVIGAVLKNGDFASFVPNELMDIELVYIIQTFIDRRTERLR